MDKHPNICSVFLSLKNCISYNLLLFEKCLQKICRILKTYIFNFTIIYSFDFKIASIKNWLINLTGVHICLLNILYNKLKKFNWQQSTMEKKMRLCREKLVGKRIILYCEMCTITTSCSLYVLHTTQCDDDMAIQVGM